MHGCDTCEFREKCEDTGYDLDCGNKYECSHFEEWLDADEVMWDSEQ